MHTEVLEKLGGIVEFIFSLLTTERCSNGIKVCKCKSIISIVLYCKRKVK
jgi:hypothetical protein